MLTPGNSKEWVALTGPLVSIPLEIRRHPELAELLIDQKNATIQLLTGAFAEAQLRGLVWPGVQP
jgi:hypothetical protein